MEALPDDEDLAPLLRAYLEERAAATSHATFKRTVHALRRCLEERLYPACSALLADLARSRPEPAEEEGEAAAQNAAEPVGSRHINKALQIISGHKVPWKRHRNALLILMPWEMGLRLGELLGLEIGDFEIRGAGVFLLAGRSRGRLRRIALPARTRRELLAYLKSRPAAEKRLFVSDAGRPLPPRTAQHIVKYYLTEAGTDPAHANIRTLAAVWLRRKARGCGTISEIAEKAGCTRSNISQTYGWRRLTRKGEKR